MGFHRPLAGTDVADLFDDAFNGIALIWLVQELTASIVAALPSIAAALLLLLVATSQARAALTIEITEGVEGAMKLDKLYTQQKGFISMLKGFHGKTLGSLSLMGKKVFRAPLLPLLDGVRHAPFGDADAVEQVLEAARTVGDGIAAVVAEPIQGEAGAIVPSADYWPRVRDICNKFGILMICDEVQTGLGRTGALWGVDHWNVQPDIMMTAASGSMARIASRVSRPSRSGSQMSRKTTAGRSLR